MIQATVQTLRKRKKKEKKYNSAEASISTKLQGGEGHLEFIHILF